MPNAQQQWRQDVRASAPFAASTNAGATAAAAAASTAAAATAAAASAAAARPELLKHLSQAPSEAKGRVSRHGAACSHHLALRRRERGKCD